MIYILWHIYMDVHPKESTEVPKILSSELEEYTGSPVSLPFHIKSHTQSHGLRGRNGDLPRTRIICHQILYIPKM